MHATTHTITKKPEKLLGLPDEPTEHDFNSRILGEMAEQVFHFWGTCGNGWSWGANVAQMVAPSPLFAVAAVSEALTAVAPFYFTGTVVTRHEAVEHAPERMEIRYVNKKVDRLVETASKIATKNVMKRIDELAGEMITKTWSRCSRVFGSSPRLSTSDLPLEMAVDLAHEKAE